MDPNASLPPRQDGQSATHVPPTTGNPPVFHNPLAQGYTAHTQQLPTVQSNTVSQPAPLDADAAKPPPVATPVPAQSQIPQAQQPVQAPPVTTLPTSTSAPNNLAGMSQAAVKPAPVRLAPEPKADDMHATLAAMSAQAAPFGWQSSASASATMPQVSAGQVQRSKHHRKIAIIVTALIGVVLLTSAVVAVLFMPKKPTTKSPAVSNPATSTRDTTEKPLQPFAQKVSSDCYVFQVPTPSQIQTNKDCLMSVVYGEQKISTITVSPQREFDIVAEENTSNGSNSAQSQTIRFDTEKYLEALIANAIPKELIVTRDAVTVGKLNGTKVVGKREAAGQPVVAYVFVVMPEGDRQFNEKTFVAFVITGAYNDDYSRKGFDQALTTWSWK